MEKRLQEDSLWAEVQSRAGDLKPPFQAALEALFPINPPAAKPGEPPMSCSIPQNTIKTVTCTFVHGRPEVKVHCSGTLPRRVETDVLKVIGVTRANNVAIMLTRFEEYRDFTDIRSAVLSDAAISQEHLGLLQQVCSCSQYAASTLHINLPDSYTAPMLFYTADTHAFVVPSAMHKQRMSGKVRA